jgi:hypothetical protein
LKGIFLIKRKIIGLLVLNVHTKQAKRRKMQKIVMMEIVIALIVPGIARLKKTI